MSTKKIVPQELMANDAVKADELPSAQVAQNPMLGAVYPFLFKYYKWHSDPAIYILVYAKSESEGKIIAAKNAYSNSGAKLSVDNIISCTYGLP